MNRSTGDISLLQDFLAEHDASCPLCSYNLRGACSDRCPECGAAMRLFVGLREASLGPWIVRILAVALPLGFNAVLAAAAAIGWAVSDSFGGLDWTMLVLFTSMSLACLAGLVAIVILRHRFLAQPRHRQQRRAWALATFML